jgi:hypothetical protein
MKATPHRLGRLSPTSPRLLHQGNPACCNSSHQSQQSSDYCQPEDASAIDSLYPGIRSKTFAQPSSSTSMEQTFHENSSEYKTYLVDYRYKGQEYCLELAAVSWEDAEARVRCLINANVAGEVALKIPVPESWFKRVQKWVNGNFT